MEEIHSFNMLFHQAECAKFKLESFRQDDAGFFYAAWRTADNVIGRETKRRQPFTAALDAYLDLKETPPPEPATQQDDLFG